MSTVSQILKTKGNVVVTIVPGATALEAARLMNEKRIGCVLVIEAGKSDLLGILSERDILTRIVAGERDPRTTRVTDVMTRDVICCTPQTAISELKTVMQARRVRHVPVRDGTASGGGSAGAVGPGSGAVCGLVSIGDLNAWENTTLNQTVHSLEDYVQRP